MLKVVIGFCESSDFCKKTCGSTAKKQWLNSIWYRQAALYAMKQNLEAGFMFNMAIHRSRTWSMLCAWNVAFICSLLISAPCTCNSCRIGDVVQWVNHGPSVCLLTGSHALKRLRTLALSIFVYTAGRIWPVWRFCAVQLEFSLLCMYCTL